MVSPICSNIRHHRKTKQIHTPIIIQNQLKNPPLTFHTIQSNIQIYKATENPDQLVQIRKG